MPNIAATTAPTSSIGQNGKCSPREAEAAIRVGVGADGEERRVAEVEQARHADDDVQSDRQQDEDAGVGEAVDPHVVWR